MENQQHQQGNMMDSVKSSAFEMKKELRMDALRGVYCERMGVPKRFIKARLQDFPEPLIKLIKDSYNEQKGLYLFGGVGTGKTHLMAAVAKKLLSESTMSVWTDAISGEVEGLSFTAYPKFISVPRLLLEMRGSFSDNNGPTEEQFIKSYVEKKLLLLDDIGSEKVTEWAEQVLYLIIDGRYVNEMPLIISSNLSLGDLSNRIGDRITSRIAEMCKIIKIGGKDRRLNH